MPGAPLKSSSEGVAERDLGLIGAGPAAAFWRDSGGPGPRVRLFTFLYHFANKSLDPMYIMRNSIKINPDPKRRTESRQGGSHGAVFFTAGLLAGDPHRAV